jgi:hypothetical protein
LPPSSVSFVVSDIASRFEQRSVALGRRNHQGLGELAAHGTTRARVGSTTWAADVEIDDVRGRLVP